MSRACTVYAHIYTHVLTHFIQSVGGSVGGSMEISAVVWHHLSGRRRRWTVASAPGPSEVAAAAVAAMVGAMNYVRLTRSKKFAANEGTVGPSVLIEKGPRPAATRSISLATISMGPSLAFGASLSRLDGRSMHCWHLRGPFGWKPRARRALHLANRGNAGSDGQSPNLGIQATVLGLMEAPKRGEGCGYCRGG